MPLPVRIEKNYGWPVSYTAARGFDSAENTLNLEELNIFNGICPKSVNGLKEKLEDQRFRLWQKRRGSTEARIGILKNSYIGKHLGSKGFKHRKTRIQWCILAHNLWKLGSMALTQKEMNEKA